MDEDVESAPPPPVSSLRSRFEALSKQSATNADTSEQYKKRSEPKKLQIGRTDERPSTPSVILHPATSSSAPSQPLRRVVSTPTSQPVSPDAEVSAFASSRGSRNSVDPSSLRDDTEDVQASNTATPRRSPSTPSFPVKLSVSESTRPSSTEGDSSMGLSRGASASRVGVYSLGETSRQPAIVVNDDMARKLSRKPPPPPPLTKKQPPPVPLTRSGGLSSNPSSRSATPSVEYEETPSGMSHDRSESVSSTLSPHAHAHAPPLPSRTTPSPTLPPRSPTLPPRNNESLSGAPTLVYHPDRGFKTPSREHLSPADSDGTENSHLTLIPPKLPSRTGSSESAASPLSSKAPPLPKRGSPDRDSLPTTSAPPLPRRAIGKSAPGTLEPVTDSSSRRVPPPPPSANALRPNGKPSNGSRDSLTPTGDPYAHPSGSAPRTTSAESFLPPPARVVPSSLEAAPHHAKEHRHHFPHLPHHLNTLPKMLSAFKSGTNGAKSPGSASQSHNVPPPQGSELGGTAGLPPPPMRSIVEKVASLRRPHSSSGRRRANSDASSSDEQDDGDASPSGPGARAAGKRTIATVEELPDSSRSNRRPPVLSGFQNPPSIYAAHHHVVRSPSGVVGTRLHVPAHTGVVAVAGWWVVIASPGIITITNMNAKDRDADGDQTDHEEVYHPLQRDADMEFGNGAKGVWSIEMKDMPVEWKADHPRVTAMEFRHGLLDPDSGSTKSRTHHRTTSLASGKSEEGRFLWCGTKDGFLLELDVWNGGKLTDIRAGAHSGHVTGIFRLKGNRMLTLDENGKCLVFSGVGIRMGGEEGAMQIGGKTGPHSGWLGQSSPRIQRISHKNGFARVLGGRLWTSPASGHSGTSDAPSSATGTGPGDSKSSLQQDPGGSLSSLAQSAAGSYWPRNQHHHSHSHRHSHHTSQGILGPNVKVHDIDDDGALRVRSLLPGHNVGAVLCGTVLPTTPGLVYLGHEGGWITIWSDSDHVQPPSVHPTTRPGITRQDSSSSFNSMTATSHSSDDSDQATAEGLASTSPVSTEPTKPLPPPRSATLVSDDGKGPTCVGKVKISISDVLSMEGVGSRLWVGTRKGMICVYDISGNGGSEGRQESKEGLNDEKLHPERHAWAVTNVWKAHGDLPVTRLSVDPFSVATTQKLLVYSVGRDETLHFWDGFLSQNWIDSQMVLREPSYCTFRPLKALICTWNIDAAKPDALVGTNNATFFQRFLANPALEGDWPDIIVFGFQEVIDLEDKKLTAKTVLLGPGKKKTDGTISEKVSRHYRLWHDRLVAEVQRAYPSASYIVQHTENLVGLFTCIFVRRELAHPAPGVKAIRDVAITTIKCGVYGMYGNKGSIVARFIVDDTSICYLNCHLAAGQRQKVARNMDLTSILEEKAVFPASVPADSAEPGDYAAYVGGGDGSMILDHELCFLNGDLNYRIDQRRDAVKSNVQAGKLQHLLQYDQLLYEMRANPAFRLKTFREPAITFAPTYKYDRHTDTYDSSEKRRIPAWCDRILYRSRDPGRIENLWYGRYEPDISDHRPVAGVYRIRVKKIVEEKRAEELGIVTALWKREQRRLGDEARLYFESLW